MTSPLAPARVIPVIDLMSGKVVRALRGERGSYRPIETPLAPGSDPAMIARALLARCPVPSGEWSVLYVADLDALTGKPAQTAALQHLLAALPSTTLWLDAGFRDPDHARQLRQALAVDRVRPVIASESLADVHSLETLRDDASAILSLDCRLAKPMDPTGVWQRPDLWPATVIVMTLDRVGADAGPDFDTLRALRERAGPRPRRWIGAGGLRGPADLTAAADAGAQAWLVASALHDGRLDPRVAA